MSTDEDHQPYSLEAQAGRLGSYVTSQPDWELTRRFSDHASGARRARSAPTTSRSWPSSTPGFRKPKTPSSATSRRSSRPSPPARCRRARRCSKRSSTRSASKVETALYRGSACQAARTRRFAPWRGRRPRQEPGQSSDGWYG
ncbi:MAG: hypothetical protein ACYDGN_09705 [Acidimicrobiales bacterium]